MFIRVNLLVPVLSSLIVTPFPLILFVMSSRSAYSWLMQEKRATFVSSEVVQITISRII